LPFSVVTTMRRTPIRGIAHCRNSVWNASDMMPCL
jgi:hypothetical protein